MQKSVSNHIAVVADVGGTHIRFAKLTDASAPLQCVETYACALYKQLDEAIAHYLNQISCATHQGGELQMLCLALPGAVHTDTVTLANLKWHINKQELALKFDCQVIMVNDFTAQAKAIPSFSDIDLEWLRAPSTGNEGLTRAIIGPGTGLGAAALLSTGEVIESEAGHMSFSPQTPQQQALLAALWQRFPRVSVERLVSGPGLANIHLGFQLMAGSNEQLTPEEITARALTGDPECQQTMTEFNLVLGSVCGDIALAFGAVGGVYLSGGMLKNLGILFDRTVFLRQFDYKGRFTDYCKKIPVALVLSPQPGLVGAANCIRQSLGTNLHITNDHFG